MRFMFDTPAKIMLLISGVCSFIVALVVLPGILAGHFRFFDDSTAHVSVFLWILAVLSVIFLGVSLWLFHKTTLDNYVDKDNSKLLVKIASGLMFSCVFSIALVAANAPDHFVEVKAPVIMTVEPAPIVTPSPVYTNAADCPSGHTGNTEVDFAVMISPACGGKP